jgi:hypothetical protein
MNLLKIKLIRELFSTKWFPFIPQLFMLAVFVLLIAGSIGISAKEPNFIYYLRNTNFATLIVWSYWWPCIIVTAILFGRLWCTVCPMELITYWAGKIGLKLQVPDILKSGWVVTIFYTCIWIVGVHTLGVNRIPHLMALYLLMLIILAVDVSLIFRKRAFCSYICPVGHLLGLYSLISPFQWRADDVSICKRCKTKDCCIKKNQYRLTSRSCTSNLYPATIKDNRDCLLCTQCFKACPHKNIRFSARWPFSDFFTNIELRPSEVGFILLVSSFVVYEILSEWSVSLSIMMWVPDHFTNALKISGSMSNFFAAIILFIIMPAMALFVLAALSSMVSGQKAESFGATLCTFVLLLLPTVASAHIIKSILRITSRIPYWRYALSDTKGMETAQKIVSGTLVPDKSLTDSLDTAISVAAAAVLLVALAVTMQIFSRSVVVQKHSPAVKIVLLISVLAYWFIFALTISVWRFS